MVVHHHLPLLAHLIWHCVISESNWKHFTFLAPGIWLKSSIGALCPLLKLFLSFFRLDLWNMCLLGRQKQWNLLGTRPLHSVKHATLSLKTSWQTSKRSKFHFVLHFLTLLISTLPQEPPSWRKTAKFYFYGTKEVMKYLKGSVRVFQIVVHYIGAWVQKYCSEYSFFPFFMDKVAWCTMDLEVLYVGIALTITVSLNEYSFGKSTQSLKASPNSLMNKHSVP